MIKLIRYDESNKNQEALKGQYGQEGQKDYCITVIKNMLFVVIYDGGKMNDVKIPTCYKGFLMTNKGRRIQVDGSVINATMAPDENAQGILVIKKWN
jgi:hypothetical protein